MENRKWQGSVGGIVEAPIEEVWKMVSKSSKLCEWMPMVERCTDLAGEEEGVPGHTRLVSGFMFPQENGERSWIKERLLFMDAESHTYSYRMEASNVGLDGSVNLVKVVEYDEGSTLVEWRFEMDPLEGSSEDTIMDFLGFLYKSCIHRIKGAIEVSQGKSKVVTQEIQDFDD